MNALNMSMSKTAVVLFNLGGPDSLKAVKPFLFNLFNDRAIINLPQPLALSCWQTDFHACAPAKARAIYQHLGGKSPILEHTMQQAEALEKKLKPKAAMNIKHSSACATGTR